MNFLELLRRKRDGGKLAADEIAAIVADYTSGHVTDYQMAAWLMAVRIRGMDLEETTALTLAMMRSGRVLDLSGISPVSADKHSTGGVGDKVSLVLAPLLAACGVTVPMVSGRSLGHTGGTLDKLESIPGFRTDLTEAEFRGVLRRAGAAMAGQTAEFCPADRRMYALRDVTATVDSIPLIAASIMSKKLAEGAAALVLDVKTGSGAFMSRPADASKLARVMVGIGTRLGRRVSALVTGMWQPLGRAAGNAVEVIESIECLKGNWPPDLREVTLALVIEALRLCGRVRTQAEAVSLIEQALGSGAALERMRRLIAAQGGDERVCDDYRRLPGPRHRRVVRAASPGWVRAVDAWVVGQAGVELGIGRKTMETKVDHAAGFLFRHKAGERVRAGEALVEVLGTSRAAVLHAAARVRDAFAIGPTRPRPRPLIVGRVRAGRAAHRMR